MGSILVLGGVGFTVKEVVETARKVTGHPIPAKEEPRRAGDPSMLIASSAKAREVLGWNPQYADLETIIGTAWKWHKSCLLYTSPSPRDVEESRMPSSA